MYKHLLHVLFPVSYWYTVGGTFFFKFKSNSINLIDGVNGLACGQVIISSVAISVIATKVGEPNIADLALIIANFSLATLSVTSIVL